jgi:uncharacterized protein YcnI
LRFEGDTVFQHVHDPRTARRGGAALAAVAAVAAAGLLTAPAASAHVRVIPESTAGGGFAKLTFRVPNESGTAGTTSLAVTLPEAQPLAFVSVQPVAGWTATVTKAKLATPIDVEGTTIAEAARTITWTAAPGTRIAPGQFQEFAISAGPLPESGDMVFAAAQTYSDGTVVNWNQPTPEGGEEPEHPAPEFAVTAAAAGAGGHGAAGTDGDGPDEEAASGTTAAAASDEDADDEATAALWLAGAALVVGAGGVLVGALGFRRARQP